MEVIREAFHEGRTTKTPWQKSEAKQNQLKAQVALENFSVMEKRDFHTVIPLQQIDPATGKVLRTFNSRLEAATWICENVLKRPDKNPISVTGNMEMCIRAGWKSYGYYWKVIDVKTLMDTTAGNGTKIFGKINQKVRGFDSINEVAEYTGISRKVIARQLAKAKGVMLQSKKFTAPLYIQVMNKDKKTLHFANCREAAKELGVAMSTINNWVNKGEVVNNYTITLDSIPTTSIKPKYQLYQGRKVVGVYDKQQDLAAKLGVDRKRIYTALKKNGDLGLGYTVKKIGG